MHTDPTTQREKIEAAYILLTEETTTFEKFEKIRKLIHGINPSVDKTLHSASSALKKLKQHHEGEVIELSVGELPEKTEKEKKRKKALLLFITSWKSLRSEVKKVKDLYQSQETDGKISGHKHITTIGKAFTFAKGPFGLITALALVIVGVGVLLKNASVSITIKNSGCGPLTPVVSLPFSIPGLQLPTETIVDGHEAVAIIPPLTVSVNGTEVGIVKISAFSFTMDYMFQGGNTDIVFDNASLLGKRTVINLGESKQHELIIVCR